MPTLTGMEDQHHHWSRKHNQWVLAINPVYGRCVSQCYPYKTHTYTSTYIFVGSQQEEGVRKEVWCCRTWGSDQWTGPQPSGRTGGWHWHRVCVCFCAAYVLWLIVVCVCPCGYTCAYVHAFSEMCFTHCVSVAISGNIWLLNQKQQHSLFRDGEGNFNIY